MLFNSYEFALFFFIVYGLYLVVDHKKQNWLLLIASYYFYGSWDWRFLSLILASTIIDFFCGLKIENSLNSFYRKRYLFISIACNLSFLGFFKYFNFFAENLQEMLLGFGILVDTVTLNIVLPVGISFYTFQTMSYTIDIYKKELKPTRNFFDFALFVAFFPQLVAGPIERAKRLLPQISMPRSVTLEKVYEGGSLIYWGLFQKIFVADNLAKIVDPVFSSNEPQNGLIIIIAVYAFAFQIFCDFAGYSNIARGVSKCLGIEIMVNFRLPYFSTNPSEFWRRWHISLSTWLRDYLYIPLGGNRKGKYRTYINLMATMLLGGLWHGAGWTFVVWGAYQGVLLSAHRAVKPVFQGFTIMVSPIAKIISYWFRVVVFFQLVCVGWVFFRAQDLGHATMLLQSIFSNFSISHGLGIRSSFQTFLFYTAILLVIQLIQLKTNDLMIVDKFPKPVMGALYGVMFCLMAKHAITGHSFIYFQF